MLAGRCRDNVSAVLDCLTSRIGSSRFDALENAMLLAVWALAPVQEVVSDSQPGLTPKWLIQIRFFCSMGPLARVKSALVTPAIWNSKKSLVRRVARVEQRLTVPSECLHGPGAHATK